jgi:hypothetical protein
MKAEKLELRHVKDVLGRHQIIASAKGRSNNRVVLDYSPLNFQFRIHHGMDLDNVYSAWGIQMAIDRYNELVGAS